MMTLEVASNRWETFLRLDIWQNIEWDMDEWYLLFSCSSLIRTTHTIAGAILNHQLHQLFNSRLTFTTHLVRNVLIWMTSVAMEILGLLVSSGYSPKVWISFGNSFWPLEWQFHFSCCKMLRHRKKRKKESRRRRRLFLSSLSSSLCTIGEAFSSVSDRVKASLVVWSFFREEKCSYDKTLFIFTNNAANSTVNVATDFVVAVIGKVNYHFSLFLSLSLSSPLDAASRARMGLKKDWLFQSTFLYDTGTNAG